MPGTGPDGAARQSCAGAIVLDDRGRLLLIRRGQEPSIGLWSVPGGRCRPGESTPDACVRETAEETGLAVRVVRFAGAVQLPGPGAVVYDIDDFVCAVVGGELAAADDAIDARWVSADELAVLDMVPGLVACLREWDAMPS